MASYTSDGEEQDRLIVPPEGEAVDSLDAYVSPLCPPFPIHHNVRLNEIHADIPNPR